MTTTTSEVYADVVLLYKLNFFQSWTFLIKIYNILKNNILTWSCWASVESWLLWRYASRSSLLYSGFRYTIELPLQPYKIQLYTFRVQGLAFFLPWFPDYTRWDDKACTMLCGSYANVNIRNAMPQRATFCLLCLIEKKILINFTSREAQIVLRKMVVTCMALLIFLEDSL